MTRGAVSWAMLVMLVMSSSLLGFNTRLAGAPPSTIVVPDSYPTIQEAINVAVPGDLIFVKNGIYYEHVVVNKTVSLLGEDMNKTIIDGSQTGTVVTLTKNYINMTGFSIRNSRMESPDEGSGIYLDRVSNCNISGNNITNNYYGMWLVQASSNRICHNSMEAALCAIIICYHSDNNVIMANSITNNDLGIEIEESTNNLVSKNSITGKGGAMAIWIRFSNNNTVSGNNMINNGFLGVWLYKDAHYNIVSGNNITGSDAAIWIFDNSADNNTLCENDLYNNDRGIEISGYPSNNSIYRNNIVNNNFGVYIHLGFSNSFYHNNFVNNSVQAYVDWEDVAEIQVNFWDDGYPSGGNYWSDYTGADVLNGPYQNVTGSDGVGDSPYVMDGNNTDRYPITTPIRPVPWDITGPTIWIPDAKCDIRDVALVAVRFGSVVGDSEYDRRADITGSTYLVPDLKIDIRDIATVARNFGKVDP